MFTGKHGPVLVRNPGLGVQADQNSNLALVSCFLPKMKIIIHYIYLTFIWTINWDYNELILYYSLYIYSPDNSLRNYNLVEKQRQKSRQQYSPWNSFLFFPFLSGLFFFFFLSWNSKMEKFRVQWTACELDSALAWRVRSSSLRKGLLRWALNREQEGSRLKLAQGNSKDYLGLRFGKVKYDNA